MNLKYALVALMGTASFCQGQEPEKAAKLSLSNRLANQSTEHSTPAPAKDTWSISLTEMHLEQVNTTSKPSSLKASRGEPKPLDKEDSTSTEKALLSIESNPGAFEKLKFFVTPESNVDECVDSVSGWYDSDGATYNCDWYAAGNGRCEIFGNYAENFGYTANEACCACGGGSPSTNRSPGDNQCVDDPEDWHDADGSIFTCQWYAAASHRCAQYGDSAPNNGQTANDVCCVCGGGSFTERGGDGQCLDSPPGWTDSFGDGCDWYDEDSRCSNYGNSFANNGFTASTACCVCGGGATSGTETGSVVYGLQPSCNSPDPSNYNMCLDLSSISGTTEPWMGAFAAARDLWETIIVGDLGTSFSSSSLKTGNEYTCTGYPTTIDDSYICGTDANIDGPYGVLGSAGPRYGRYSSETNPLTSEPYLVTLSGYMRFDTADIDRMIVNGSFENVILHEMGHVLGIGSLWEANGLYADGSGVYSTGTHAQTEWEAIGCSGGLPVELDGGQGTADSHFDEQCLRHELMTGNLSGSGQPLSRITIASMEDIGYSVDYSQADPFSTSDLGTCGAACPGARRLRTNARGLNKKPLSEQGRAAVLSYAKTEFDVLSKEEPEELPDGIIYVAPEEIDVLYEDEEGIRVVKVSRKETESD